MTNREISRRRVLGTAALGGLALGSLAGCGWGRPSGNSSSSTSLSIWDTFSTEPQKSAVDKLYKKFMSAHPKLKVERNIVPYDQMVALAKTALPSGTGPDLIYYSVGRGSAGVLVDAGLISPLDDLADEMGWRDKISPTAVHEVTINGKMYGLPNESEIEGWWYNKSLFEKHSLSLPETIDDLRALTTTAEKSDLVPVAYGQGDSYTSWWLLSQVASNALQAQPLNQLVYENQGRWDTPKLVDAIKTIFTDLPRAGTFGKKNINALKAQGAEDLFSGEKALMVVDGSWAAGQFSDALPNAGIGIMPVPSFHGEHRVFSAGSGGAYWLSSNSKNPEAAKEYLRFALSDDAVRIWVEDAQVIPPVQFDPSAWDITDLQKRLAVKISGGDEPKVNLGCEVNHGLATPPFLNMMTSGFQAMIAGKKSAQEQASALQDAWEKGVESLQK